VLALRAFGAAIDSLDRLLRLGAGPLLTPLDQTRLARHKTRHENGYLHYLPEDYSLAHALARPFSSPK